MARAYAETLSAGYLAAPIEHSSSPSNNNKQEKWIKPELGYLPKHAAYSQLNSRGGGTKKKKKKVVQQTIQSMHKRYIRVENRLK